MTNQDATLNISKQTFDILARRAQALQRPIEELADELLRSYIQPTDHAYIVRREGFRGGNPILRGSNIPVWLIVAMWRAGDTPEEITDSFPNLEAAPVYDAISYYLDHKQEIESQIEQNRIQRLLAEAGVSLDANGAVDLFDG